MAKITFSIVTYRNDVHALNELLGELIELSASSRHIISVIITDNSVQGETSTSEIKRPDNLRLTIIHNVQNLGFGIANDEAFSIEPSDYFVVMNPDIHKIVTRQFDDTIDMMQQNKNLGLVVPKLVNSDGSLQHTNKRQSTVLDQLIRFLGPGFMKKRQEKFIQINGGYKNTMPTKNAHGAFMIFRSDAFRVIGGFDKRYFLYMEDTDITMSIIQKFDAIYYPKLVVQHQWQQANRNSSGIRAMLVSMIKYYSKWGWKFF